MADDPTHPAAQPAAPVIGHLAPPETKHQRWFDLAFATANDSPHPQVRVGAVVVSADGRKLLANNCNGFAVGPLGAVEPLPIRLMEGEKSFWLMCAEKRALHTARQHGHVQGGNLAGCCLYATLDPCHTCADDIIGAGISTVYVPLAAPSLYPNLKDKWQKSMSVGAQKMREAGIKLVHVRVQTPPRVG